MKRLSIRKKLLFFIILTGAQLLIILPNLLYAMEEGGKKGTDWMGWAWKILNFAVLIFILVKFFGKPMREYFKKRTEIIEQSLKEAREAKELAQKALREVQEKLTLKDQEIERIISSAKQTGESEKDNLIKQGMEMSEKIKEQAKLNIEVELKNAKAALRADAAELAIRLAEKKLKEELTEEDKLKLIEDSIKRLEG